MNVDTKSWKLKGLKINSNRFHNRLCTRSYVQFGQLICKQNSKWHWNIWKFMASTNYEQNLFLETEEIAWKESWLKKYKFLTITEGMQQNKK